MGAAVALALMSGTAATAQEPSGSPGSGAAWTELTSPAFSGLQSFLQAASTEAEIIVIGSRCDPEGACQHVVLATPDGTTWSERGVLPADVDRLADLIADGSDLYAVGDRGDGQAAIWRSVDGGASWQLLGGQEAFLTGADGRRDRSPSGDVFDASVLALARGPRGLLAGGWLNGEDLDRSAIWLSVDGTAWERVRLRRPMDQSGGVFDLAGDGDAYVAVTEDGLWRSADGRRWKRLSAAGTPADVVTDIEATDMGFTGFGVGGPTASVWTSGADGFAWQRQADDPALARLWEAELRAIGPDVVAVGLRDGDERIPTAWLLDGTTWTAETITATPDARPADVVASADALIVVGSAPTAEGTPSAAAWRRPFSPSGAS